MAEKILTWDEMSEKDQLESIYSDVYKDIHGFRPRGFNYSVKELKAELDLLQIEMNSLIEENDLLRHEAVANIENNIDVIRDICSCDRESALRMIKDAEGDDFYNWENFCFQNHLPSDYFQGVA